MKLTALLLAVLAGLVGWVVADPFMTMHALQLAADRNDSDLLARNIDFPVLRENLKPQVRPLVDQRLDRESEKHSWAVLGKRYSGQIADGAVDALITPRGLAQLLSREGHKKKKGKKKKRAAAGNGQPATREWQFNSASEFEMDIKKDDRLTRFILTRYGLVWKLTNIILPGK